MSNESNGPRRPRVFVDMDGVLANFNKAAAPIFGLKYPTEPSIMDYNWVFLATQEQHGKTLSHPDFIDGLRNRPEFWEQMEFYWWAKRISIQLTASKVEWYILTHCVDDPYCPYGKHHALKRNLGDDIIKRTFMTFGPKHPACRPGDVLIDDAEKNCVAWREAGGHAFNWVDYTDNHPNTGYQVEELFRFLQERNVYGQ